MEGERVKYTELQQQFDDLKNAQLENENQSGNDDDNELNKLRAVLMEKEQECKQLNVELQSVKNQQQNMNNYSVDASAGQKNEEFESQSNGSHAQQQLPSKITTEQQVKQQQAQIHQQQRFMQDIYRSLAPTDQAKLTAMSPHEQQQWFAQQLPLFQQRQLQAQQRQFNQQSNVNQKQNKKDASTNSASTVSTNNSNNGQQAPRHQIATNLTNTQIQQLTRQGYVVQRNGANQFLIIPPRQQQQQPQQLAAAQYPQMNAQNPNAFANQQAMFIQQPYQTMFIQQPYAIQQQQQQAQQQQAKPSNPSNGQY